MKISKYNQRPLFYNCSASFKPSEEEFATLYLDVHRDIVKDYSFEHGGMDKWIPSFSLLGEKILGKNLSEVREISLEDEFVSLPLKLLGQALNKYIGITYRHELLKEKSDTLICRCFGVFRGQIIDVLKTTLSSELITILDGTDAMGGCSSCVVDVENIVEVFRGEQILTVSKKERVLGLSPVELHLKINELVKEWDVKNEVLEIKNNLIILKIISNEEKLKKHLNETFGEKLLFSFLS